MLCSNVNSMIYAILSLLIFGNKGVWQRSYDFWMYCDQILHSFAIYTFCYECNEG